VSAEGLVVWIARDRDDGVVMIFSVEPVESVVGNFDRPYKNRKACGAIECLSDAFCPPGLLPGECRRYQLKEVTDE
jgi:hypothetical protein